MAMIFSKLLSKTDVEKCLAVPTKHLKSLVQSFGDDHVADFEVVDEMGYVWTFRCSIRKKRHRKPVITKGWLLFVQDKKLKKGDKIKIYREENHPSGARFRVQIEKEVKIFGAILGYAPIALP